MSFRGAPPVDNDAAATERILDTFTLSKDGPQYVWASRVPLAGTVRVHWCGLAQAENAAWSLTNEQKINLVGAELRSGDTVLVEYDCDPNAPYSPPPPEPGQLIGYTAGGFYDSGLLTRAWTSTMAFPAGTNVGDVAIVTVAVYNGSATPGAPSGWTLLKSDAGSFLYSKTLVAGDLNNGSASFSTTALGARSAQMVVYRGVTVGALASGYSGGSSATPGVTTVGVNALVLSVVTYQNNNTASGLSFNDAAVTTVGTDASGQRSCCIAGDQVVPNPTNVAPVSFSCASGAVRTFSLALEAA